MRRGAGRPRADVLLGHALFLALDPKQAEKMRPYPPLGTLYAAAHLRARGWRVALFDAHPASGPGALAEALEATRPRLLALFEDSFHFYSKMCLGRMRDAALEMVAAGRERGLPVLVAGSDATDAPEAYLAAGADAVLLGEAEESLAEAVAALLEAPGADPRPAGPSARRERLRTLPGLAFGDPAAPGGPTRTASRPPMRDPDRLPHPARDLVDMDWYRTRWRSAHGRWSLNAVSSRGCPYRCNWCAKPIWGQRYALRAPGAVAEEMAEVSARWAPDELWFADDIFGLRPDWTAAFGEAVARRGAGLPFTIQSRVDLMTDEAVEGLAAAGCAEAWLGAESGSQRILDAMEKGIRVEQVPAAVRRLRARGIRVGLFLQLGYPGEGWAEIEGTAELVRRAAPDAIGVSVSYPLPGTRFHAAVAEELGPEARWRDSRDLAMLFRGTYDTDFYRRLHGQLHAEHDARLALRDAEAGGGEAGARSARAALARAMSGWRRLAAEAPDHRRAAPTRPMRMPPAPPGPPIPSQADGASVREPPEAPRGEES